MVERKHQTIPDNFEFVFCKNPIKVSYMSEWQPGIKTAVCWEEAVK